MFLATGHQITHVTVQVEPTDHEGCKEALS
jgi:hypothetical protein